MKPAARAEDVHPDDLVRGERGDLEELIDVITIGGRRRSR